MVTQSGSSEDLKFWIGFSLVPGVGPFRIKLLLQAFGSLQRAWEATAVELSDAGIDSRTITSFDRRRNALDLDAELAKLDTQGVRALCWDDAGYPQLLREIDDPPPVLYVRGQLRPEDRTAVAVVGTRKAASMAGRWRHGWWAIWPGMVSSW